MLEKGVKGEREGGVEDDKTTEEGGDGGAVVVVVTSFSMNLLLPYPFFSFLFFSFFHLHSSIFSFLAPSPYTLSSPLSSFSSSFLFFFLCFHLPQKKLPFPCFKHHVLMLKT